MYLPPVDGQGVTVIVKGQNCLGHWGGPEHNQHEGSWREEWAAM